MYLQVFSQKRLDLGGELDRGIEMQHVPGLIDTHRPVTRAMCPGIDAEVSRQLAFAARNQQHIRGYRPPASFGLGPPVKDRIRQLVQRVRPQNLSL